MWPGSHVTDLEFPSGTGNVNSTYYHFWPPQVTDLEFPSGTGNTYVLVHIVGLTNRYRFRIPFRDWKPISGLLFGILNRPGHVTDLEFPSGTGNDRTKITHFLLLFPALQI